MWNSMVPNCSEVDNTSILELSAEELENMLSGLLRFLQGLAGSLCYDSS